MHPMSYVQFILFIFIHSLHGFIALGAYAHIEMVKPCP